MSMKAPCKGFFIFFLYRTPFVYLYGVSIRLYIGDLYSFYKNIERMSMRAPYKGYIGSFHKVLLLPSHPSPSLPFSLVTSPPPPSFLDNPDKYLNIPYRKFVCPLCRDRVENPLFIPLIIDSLKKPYKYPIQKPYRNPLYIPYRTLL